MLFLCRSVELQQSLFEASSAVDGQLSNRILFFLQTACLEYSRKNIGNFGNYQWKSIVLVLCQLGSGNLNRNMIWDVRINPEFISLTIKPIEN